MEQEKIDELHLAISLILALVLAVAEILKALGGKPLTMPAAATISEIVERVRLLLGDNPRLRALLKEIAGEEAERQGVPDLEKADG